MGRRTEHDGAERERHRCGDQRKQRAFGHELLDDPPAAGAERDSNRNLLLACDRACQEQGGRVRRADEQQHGREGDDDRAGADDFGPVAGLQQPGVESGGLRDDDGRSLTWMHGVVAGGDDARFHGRRLQRHAGRQAAHDEKPAHARVDDLLRVPPRGGGNIQRKPDVDGIDFGAGKGPLGHADDRVALLDQSTSTRQSPRDPDRTRRSRAGD